MPLVTKAIFQYDQHREKNRKVFMRAHFELEQISSNFLVGLKGVEVEALGEAFSTELFRARTELPLHSALHLRRYHRFSLPFRGIRECLPQFKQVITT